MQLNNKLYTINYSKLVTCLIPVMLRKPKMIAWLNVMVDPIRYLYEAFIKYKDYTTDRLLFTPQVCYLERALNKNYDIAQRGIYIDDGFHYSALPLYKPDEDHLVTIYTKKETTEKPKILYTKSETGSFGTDFIIYVPGYVLNNKDEEAFKNEMSAFVDTYKLASKIYKIQIY